MMEHRAGIEPANTGFADQRVSHFATGAHVAGLSVVLLRTGNLTLYTTNKNPTILKEWVGRLRFDSDSIAYEHTRMRLQQQHRQVEM